MFCLTLSRNAIKSLSKLGSLEYMVHSCFSWFLAWLLWFLVIETNAGQQPNPWRTKWPLMNKWNGQTPVSDWPLRCFKHFRKHNTSVCAKKWEMLFVVIERLVVWQAKGPTATEEKFDGSMPVKWIIIDQRNALQQLVLQRPTYYIGLYMFMIGKTV